MLVESVDFFRLDANRKLDPSHRSEFGQFMTPPPTARLMASMFQAKGDELTLLDAGAGVGSLLAAFISEISARSDKPRTIEVTAYEIDPTMIGYLRRTFDHCLTACQSNGIAAKLDLIEGDFIEEGISQLRQEMFVPVNRFNCAILNPPYKKINSASGTRSSLREIGIETSNLYTAFLSVVLKLLEPGGELVAITPRSFCNGPYFKPFRKLLLETMALNRIHIFESRQSTFKDDDVLQENVIFYAIKGEVKRENVTITSSSGPDDQFVELRELPYENLVNPKDPEYFIHIVSDEIGASVAEQIGRLYWSLEAHDVEVSTGRVVDFRADEFLCPMSAPGTVPLIYPRNFENGFVVWPKLGSKKSENIADLPETRELLVPKGTYVVVKRFSAKEEARRVVAAVYDPNRIGADQVGFENHINYFHRRGAGLPPLLALGLTAFLNSTLVDLYFRQFSGHTQVNAADLRNLKYPSRSQLEALGSMVSDVFPPQEILDGYVQEAIKLEDATGLPDPVQAKKRIDEALNILKVLGLPREQLNERSALTLLSLLELTPDSKWSKAKDPLMGITPMMNFFHTHYGKRYAPNSRETVRRQTVHQFLAANLVTINPDHPERPTNSPNAVYRIEAGLLQLLKTFGTRRWKSSLATYLSTSETLKEKYAQAVEKIIKEFCERFAPGGILIYLGDTDEKVAHFEIAALEELGVVIETHGKMPDVIVYAKNKNWLILVEAVTSHGPVNPKRRSELKEMFAHSTAGLVFVTAFLDRHAMVKYLGDISWETEVWVADAPSHLIHFDGERFLGPYESEDKRIDKNR